MELFPSKCRYNKSFFRVSHEWCKKPPANYAKFVTDAKCEQLCDQWERGKGHVVQEIFV